MSLNRYVLICLLPTLITGCAEFNGPQPTAPVYGGYPSVDKTAAPQPTQKKKSKKSKSVETVKIAPLEGTDEIKSEPLSNSEPAPLKELKPFEPFESRTSLSPAVGALVSSANQNTKAGDLDSAAVSIERAIRIEPRNADLFYKLAVLRIQQSKPRLAEDLAKKSALLASNNNVLKKQSWLLIAYAREMQRDSAGAKAARAKADSF
ncbi:MAG: tetratricopeptide repeat protein [Methylobacter sp.]|nr:tetratricopeptide repeat protein [Methylobacter sp.]